MQRDWNLIRDILEAIEQDRIVPYLRNAGNSEEWQNGLDTDQINAERIRRLRLIDGHIRLLIDCDLISKVNSNVRDVNEYRKRLTDSPRHGYTFKPECLELSMEGHDLLDHMRDPVFWNEIKKIAKDSLLSVSLDFIREVTPKVLNYLIKL